MELNTIEMDRTEAQRAFIAYKNAVKQRHSEEDAEIMRGYRALARGMQLIKLTDTMKAGGTMEVTHNGWRNGHYVHDAVSRVPRLAIARASARFSFLHTSADGAASFHDDKPLRKWRSKFVTYVPARTFEGLQHGNGEFKALVPPVPPQFRPATSLDNFHILWEAEWTKIPPTDPALLRHIGGDLYAVLAIWDLTELERAVLTRRFE